MNLLLITLLITLAIGYTPTRYPAPAYNPYPPIATNPAYVIQNSQRAIEINKQPQQRSGCNR